MISLLNKVKETNRRKADPSGDLQDDSGGKEPGNPRRNLGLRLRSNPFYTPWTPIIYWLTYFWHSSRNDKQRRVAWEERKAVYLLSSTLTCYSFRTKITHFKPTEDQRQTMPLMKNTSGNHAKKPTCALPSQQVSVESYTDSSPHGTYLPHHSHTEVLERNLDVS